MNPILRNLQVALMKALALLILAWPVAAEPPDFQREVRPILSNHCFACHGPDAHERKAGLRLDTYEGAVALRKGVRAIDPEALSKSELLARLFTDDLDERMPPPEELHALSWEQQDILRRWVLSGAEYKTHWAFVRPRAKDVPPARFGSEHPVDRFVHARLKPRNLRPSPGASRQTLIRRLTLDLTGLPPKPSDVDAFVTDSEPMAYERLVDRLLASVHYGERMAVAWMDVARYGDTDGLNADAARYMWSWRDWVVRAYNANMPFDQFLEEQLAGDLLPRPTRDQLIATGFNRNNVTSDEGGAIPEELRVQYVVDRVKTSFNAFQALSVECAQCHDHKYDPISQEEYFGLYAFFNSAADPGLQSRKQNQAPYIPAAPEFASEELRKLAAELEVLQAKRAELQPADGEFKEWFNAAKSQSDTMVVAGDWYHIGNFSADAAQDIADERIPIIPGAPDMEKSYRSFRWHPVPNWYEASPNTVRMHKDSSRYCYRQLTARAAMSMDLSVSAGGKVWLNGHVVKLSKGAGTLKLSPGDNQLIIKVQNKSDGMLKLTFTFAPWPVPQAVAAAILAESANDEARVFYRNAIWSTLREQQARIADRTVALEKLLAKGHSTMVMQERMDSRPTYVLKRGLYDAPDRSRVIQPSTPAFLNAFAPAFPHNRLGLARWMTEVENPMTARVAVNRYWSLFFGSGLVDSPMDFGGQGVLPTHPDLLDWLALRFVESGWDVKGMLKTIVTSATYKQASRGVDDLQGIDPENRWLWRGPRFRLQAEFIRDMALSASGLMNLTMGGPGVKVYQPPGLWQEVSDGGNLRYRRDKGDRLYRRSMYVFHKRSVPNPTLASFDTPSREKCVVVRERSNTPLQALVLLNDTAFVEAARHFAARMMTEGGESFAERVDFGFRIVTSREASPEEIAVCEALFEKRLASFKAAPERADGLLKTGESPNPEGLDPVEQASWTAVASLLLNLHETLTRH